MYLTKGSHRKSEKIITCRHRPEAERVLLLYVLDILDFTASLSGAAESIDDALQLTSKM